MQPAPRSSKKWKERIDKEYKGFSDHLKKFNGLLEKNQKAEVIRMKSENIIVVTLNWRGAVSDDGDWELWLVEHRKTRFSEIDRFRCILHTFGTISVLAGSYENLMGEPAGDERLIMKSEYIVTFDNFVYPSSISFQGIIRRKNHYELKDLDRANFEVVR